MPVVKYSKESASIINLKHDFFERNNVLLNNSRSINDIYIRQDERRKCKNCDSKIDGKDFISFGVKYAICERCSHLNGKFEDSEYFVKYLYNDDGGDNYKENYLNNYDARVKAIYIPKCDFLVEVLAAEGCATGVGILDMGCGGGHFVRACEKRNIVASGYDPSQALIELGATKLTTNTIRRCAMDDFEPLIAESASTVVSMIGVLEHLRAPRAALSAFTRSGAEFLYISVPLFSFSVLLEHASPKVFPRQLSAGHTHLYTEQSLAYLAEEFGLSVVGEWWFGTDIVDLYRTMLVQSSSNKPRFEKAFKRLFGEHIDALQNVLDRNKVSSEVHMVFRKR